MGPRCSRLTPVYDSSWRKIPITLIDWVREHLGRRALWQSFNLILRQLRGIFVATALEISTQENIVLQGFHVVVEVCNPCLCLGHRVTHGTGRLFEIAVELFVVNERPGSSLSSIDLGADRV